MHLELSWDSLCPSVHTWELLTAGYLSPSARHFCLLLRTVSTQVIPASKLSSFPPLEWRHPDPAGRDLASGRQLVSKPQEERGAPQLSTFAPELKSLHPHSTTRSPELHSSKVISTSLHLFDPSFLQF